MEPASVPAAEVGGGAGHTIAMLGGTVDRRAARPHDAAMTATTSLPPTAPPLPTVADIAPTAATNGPASGARRPRSAAWALWGAGAGVLGFLATGVTDTQGRLYEEGVTLDAQDAVREVERWGYHAGIVLGIAATFCLLVAAAGWRRWASERAPDNLAARVVPMAMTASAGAMILGYGFKGALAVYLPGGMDEGTFTLDSLSSIFMFLDFAPYMVWWGVCFAAIAMTWLSLRDRALPRWIGVVGVPFSLAPIVFMAATGLPGFPGVVDSLWLTIVSVGTFLGGRRAASA
jgi:hypothetical protein